MTNESHDKDDDGATARSNWEVPGIDPTVRLPSSDGSHRRYDDEDDGSSTTGPTSTSSMPSVSLEDLEAFVRERAVELAEESGPYAKLNYSAWCEELGSEDPYAVTLDGDAYQRASQLAAEQPDGSLPWLGTVEGEASAGPANWNPWLMKAATSVWAAPNAPNVAPGRSMSNTVSEQDLAEIQRVWMSTKESMLRNASASEELHTRVMEGEDGFQRQSDAFKAFLLDPRRAEDAWRERHSKAFRERQAAAMAELEQQISEVQESLLSMVDRKNQITCSRCGCRMDEAEIRRNEGVRRKICRICLADDIVRRSQRQS